MIVKDLIDDFIWKCKEVVFGVIGMNIISECWDMLFICEIFVDGDLNEVFVENSVFDNRFIYGFVWVKGIFFVCILVNIVIVVECIGLYIDGDVIVDFLINGGYLYCNFWIVFICVIVSKGKLWVRVVNIGDEDIYLKLCMMIGIVLKCDVENKNLSIGFNCVGSVEEVFV